MSKAQQPAVKSYFFGKGYKDLYNTIKEAWQRNFKSISECLTNIRYRDSAKNFITKNLFFSTVWNIFSLIAILFFGTGITIIISLINIIILLIFMVFVYIGFSLIWLTDRIYLTKNKIFTACHECKEKSLIPTYICPKCGAKHTDLTPGVYGILHRTCTGEDPDSFCGQKLPVTFFNGRRDLKAICPSCSTPLSDREAIPICIPVVGGRSVGKTAYITAFSTDFIENVAPQNGWDIEFYNERKEEIYNEITRDYQSGNTRMTERAKDINQTSSISFSFFVKGKEFKRERLIHVYDIAGEVFTDNSENEIQKQYEYCQGIVLMIDPFAIPEVKYKYESQLTAEDKAGIGKADINEIVDSFLNKLREVTGLSSQKMSSVPLAVIIGKVDSADLDREIGDTAVKNKIAEDPETFNDYYNTQDYLCREFLRKNNMEGFLSSVDLKFKDNRYFACSAIGHTRGHGKYNPQGVLPPMQWLFGKADNQMKKSWNEINFSKTVLKTKNKSIPTG